MIYYSRILSIIVGNFFQPLSLSKFTQRTTPKPTLKTPNGTKNNHTQTAKNFSIIKPHSDSVSYLIFYAKSGLSYKIRFLIFALFLSEKTRGENGTNRGNPKHYTDR